MARLNGVLEFLKTLIQSTIDNMIQISMKNLLDIGTYLKNAHEKIEFLQLESQFQQDELQQIFHSKNTHQKPTSDGISKIEVDSDPVPNEAT